MPFKALRVVFSSGYDIPPKYQWLHGPVFWGEDRAAGAITYVSAATWLLLEDGFDGGFSFMVKDVVVKNVCRHLVQDMYMNPWGDFYVSNHKHTGFELRIERLSSESLSGMNCPRVILESAESSDYSLGAIRYAAAFPNRNSRHLQVVARLAAPVYGLGLVGKEAYIKAAKYAASDTADGPFLFGKVPHGEMRVVDVSMNSVVSSLTYDMYQ